MTETYEQAAARLADDTNGSYSRRLSDSTVVAKAQVYATLALVEEVKALREALTRE